MGDAESLSALIGIIYDAALDPSRWPDALASARDFIGGCAATVYMKDASSKTGSVFYEDGRIERRFVSLYFERYVKLDPATMPHFFADVDEPLATADFIPYDQFVKSRFYQEWAKPQNLVDHVTTVIDKSLTNVAMFGVFRDASQGVADDEMRRRMRLVSPHVRRAILVSKLLDGKTNQADMLADTLDGMGASMFLVDAGGRIVHANAAAFAMIGNPGPLRVTDARLVASDPAANRVLEDIFTAAGAGDSAVGIKGIAVSLQSPQDERFVAHVLPLTDGARRRAGAKNAAVAAVFVHKATLDTPSPPEVIANAYKLTPSELRVLLAIVEIGGVSAVAEALGLGETTVKFHLRGLFEKTGTHRQAELVKLVAGYMSPLVPATPGPLPG